MKIVDRDTFLTLPSGTVYSRYESVVSTGLEVKRDSIEHGDGFNDWFYVSFIGQPETNIHQQHCDACFEMEKGKEIPIEPCQLRDGCFDYDEQFLIYSKDDVEQIVSLLD